ELMFTFHGVIDTWAVYVDAIDTSIICVDILPFYRHMLAICRLHQFIPDVIRKSHFLITSRRTCIKNHCCPVKSRTNLIGYARGHVQKCNWPPRKLEIAGFSRKQRPTISVAKYRELPQF